jgi:xylulokinase
VVADTGAVIAASSREHVPFSSPGPAWAEQQPEDWWRAAHEAARAAVQQSGVDPAGVRGIGLSGQMHGAVLLDARGSVVRPAIIWCDQRSGAQCEWLDRQIGRDRLLQLTCNPALPNFTLTKLLWVREYEPALWDRVRRVLLPKDYVRFRMSGDFGTDVADASGTLMLDVAKRRWSAGVLEAAAIDAGLLPSVFESPEVCATLTNDAAELMGLVPGTPIVAGAGDQAAGAVGVGITRPGAVSATIGTSGVVFAATDRPALDPRGRIHTFCHAIPGRWHVMGVTQAAGLSLRWIRDQWSAAGHALTYDDLTQWANDAPAGSDGVLWAPYLMGERTPHLDSNVRAALVGLAANHTHAHVVRAVLEGVAFSLRDSFTIFRELSIPITRIRLGGGGARSNLWREIQAAIYDHDVECVAADEGAAYGAALLAGVGARIWSSVDEACESTITVGSVTHPRSDWVPTMNSRYETYRRIYEGLRYISEQVRS